MDLSLNCPGFAVLQIENGTAKLLETRRVDNHKNTKKTTGCKLQEIAREIHQLLITYNPDVIVRERGFSRFARETQALFRVVGVSDLMVYDIMKKDVAEIAPSTIKMIIAGSGNSRKHMVAARLSFYVGEHVYVTDDESDAVAVGIAWAISRGDIQQEVIRPKRKKRNRSKRKTTEREENIQDV